MKKILLLLGLVVMLLAVPMASADATLKASLLRYEPLPAAPGQFVTVYVKLENVGSSDAKDVVLRMKDQFPFSITREADRTESIGKLQSQQSVVVDYRVRVDSTAFIGTNKMVFEFSEDANTDEWQESSFNINVESGEASLTITKVEAVQLIPGGEGTVSITVKNNEETVLRNIALQLELIATLGTTSIDLPFIPVDSATEKRISKLNPGEINTVTYTIKSYPSATPGYYKLPLTISYVNDQGSETTTSDYAGIIIDAVPEIKILLDETTITKDSMKGTVTFQYINKGINDLKFLNSKILASEGYTITSSNEDYIGDLDSDDFRSETYAVSLEEEDINFDIEVTFKDENNKNYEQIISVPVRFAESEESNGSTGTIIIVVLVIVAVILFVRYKRNKNKKRK